MRQYEDIIAKLVEIEDHSLSMHHFYLSGKSATVLEAYGYELIEKLEKVSKCSFKGIVKHFSMIMPYFDENNGAEKFLLKLKESVSIARDCYDEYAGFIMVEFDKEWDSQGLNDSISRVLEYMNSLKNVRFIVLFPTERSDSKVFYTALSTIGVWAYVEFLENDISTSIEQWNNVIVNAGYQLSEPAKEELYQILEHRHEEIVDMEQVLLQWLHQISLNHRIAESNQHDISIDDIRILAGITTKTGKRTMGFGR